MNISSLSSASGLRSALIRGEEALGFRKSDAQDLEAHDFSALLTDKSEVSEEAKARDLELKEKFQDFVAGTFYKEMLKSMRNTQNKPAYFHGGQAEDIFQSQMDDLVTQDLARKHGDKIAGPLYTVYTHGRK